MLGMLLWTEAERADFVGGDVLSTPSPLVGEGWGDPDVSGQTPALSRAGEGFEEIRVNSTPRATPRHLGRELPTRDTSAVYLK